MQLAFPSYPAICVTVQFPVLTMAVFFKIQFKLSKTGKKWTNDKRKIFDLQIGFMACWRSVGSVIQLPAAAADSILLEQNCINQTFFIDFILTADTRYSF